MAYESNEANYLPNPEDVNAAYQEVQDHNRKRTGLGAGMVNIFKAVLEAEDADPDASAEDIYAAVYENLENAATEGDMNGELVEMFHDDTFTRIGMKLAPLGSYLQASDGNRVTSTGLEPVIVNTELFTDYLTALQPEDVQDGKMPILGAAVSRLRATVNVCFNPTARKELPEDTQAIATQIGEDALRTFVAIDPEYRRLGLDATGLRARHSQKPEGEDYLWLSKDASPEQKAQKAAHDTYDQARRDAGIYETMEAYVTYWGKDLLPEFIEADNGQYLDDPEDQSFGPAQWHHDGGQTHWPEALAFVYRLAQEPRTAEFAEEVRRGLLRSLDAAITEAETIEGKQYSYLKKQKEDLVNIRHAITGEDYDAERFIKYTKRPEW
jgi:hypothetical protein